MTPQTLGPIFGTPSFVFFFPFPVPLPLLLSSLSSFFFFSFFPPVFFVCGGGIDSLSLFIHFISFISTLFILYFKTERERKNKDTRILHYYIMASKTTTPGPGSTAAAAATAAEASAPSAASGVSSSSPSSGLRWLNQSRHWISSMVPSKDNDDSTSSSSGSSNSASDSGPASASEGRRGGLVALGLDLGSVHLGISAVYCPSAPGNESLSNFLAGPLMTISIRDDKAYQTKLMKGKPTTTTDFAICANRFTKRVLAPFLRHTLDSGIQVVLRLEPPPYKKFGFFVVHHTILSILYERFEDFIPSRFKIQIKRLRLTTRGGKPKQRGLKEVDRRKASVVAATALIAEMRNASRVLSALHLLKKKDDASDAFLCALSVTESTSSMIDDALKEARMTLGITRDSSFTSSKKKGKGRGETKKREEPVDLTQSDDDEEEAGTKGKKRKHGE